MDSQELIDGLHAAGLAADASAARRIMEVVDDDDSGTVTQQVGDAT